jgi:hypothetical protein
LIFSTSDSEHHPFFLEHSLPGHGFVIVFVESVFFFLSFPLSWLPEAKPIAEKRSTAVENISNFFMTSILAADKDNSYLHSRKGLFRRLPVPGAI